MKFLKEVKANIDNRAEEFSAPYLAFGWFGLINYPIYYYVWLSTQSHTYESFWFRLIATVLSLLIIVKKFWPQKLKNWFPIFWYLSVLYCLPFFFTFMLFMNHFSTVWLMSQTVIMFWLLFLVDWASYLALLLVGIVLATIAFLLISADPLAHISNASGIIAQYIGSVGVISFFAQRKEAKEKLKVSTIRNIAGSIAHELRTPLFAIGSGFSGLGKLIPKLKVSHEIAQQNNLSVPRISRQQLEQLEALPERMELLVNSGTTFIDMFVKKAFQNKANQGNFETLSMKHCIDEAISLYPMSTNDKGLISFDSTQDFTFHGEKVLIIHVLFNLLKNALYFIKNARKGEIIISLKPGKKYNCLFFKDTGRGITKSTLPHIFDALYSRTQHGTGIGLAFSKNVITEHGGTISCQSVYGEYTIFEIRLPALAS